MSLSWKSLSKPLYLTLLILFIVIAIASIYLNNLIANYRSTIEENASRIFKQKISIEKISYLPPNFIILKNVAVQEYSLSGKRLPVFMQRIRCMFSIPLLIIKRDFVITRMSLNKSELYYPFIKENGAEILEAFRSLAQEQPLKVKIRKAILNIPQIGAPDRETTFNAEFAIAPNQSISSSGSIGLESFFSSFPELTSLNYRLQGFLTDKGIIIDNLEFKTLSTRLKLWGTLENNCLSMNGTSSFRDFPDLDIHDLTCVIKLEFPNIQIDSFNFSVQNIPFGLNGSILLSDSPRLNLGFSSFPKQPREVRLNNPQGFDAKVMGNLQQGKFNGTTRIDFIRTTKTKKSLEKVAIIFKNLALVNINQERMRMSIDEAALSYTSGNNTYDVLLKDFVTLSEFDEEKVNFITINSKFYDGFLRGKGIIDMAQIPFGHSFDLNIDRVSANKLHNLITYCSKVDGQLSSQIHYIGYPHPRLNGKVVINNGLLDNIIFFTWVTDFLTIPSLSLINFDNLSAQFLINDEAASLESIHLESEDVNLEGYFRLYENDLVSSRLTLLLSKEILKSSPKLSRLVNYLDRSVPSVSFRFQLSGLFQAMNFKWLESDFKQTLQDLLPLGLERRLET
ncbi:MAG: hypothetical protein PVI33_00510, partial [Candidatus Omnitrophota bacterium]